MSLLTDVRSAASKFSAGDKRVPQPARAPARLKSIFDSVSDVHERREVAVTTGNNAKISISWTASHRRSTELATALGFSAHFVRGQSRFLPLRYLEQWHSTRQILLSERPDAVLVMQPPPFSLYVAAWYCKKTGATLIGDLHTGAFTDPKWRWSKRSVLRLLRKFGFAVVPNGELANLCRDAGVEVHVCAAMISVAEVGSSPVSQAQVLVPLSYSFDEPVAQILEAAAATPDLTWILTGNAPENVRISAPTNVTFTGFVSANEYLKLRDTSAVMVALTTVESTMQSVGFEALSSAKPLVTSPTRVLVDYFGQSVRYAGPTVESIATVVAAAVCDAEVLKRQMSELRSAKIEAQGNDFGAIATAIEQRRRSARA